MTEVCDACGWPMRAVMRVDLPFVRPTRARPEELGRALLAARYANLCVRHAPRGWRP